MYGLAKKYMIKDTYIPHKDYKVFKILINQNTFRYRELVPLCETRIPKQFYHYIKYSRNLKYDEMADY